MYIPVRRAFCSDREHVRSMSVSPNEDTVAMFLDSRSISFFPLASMWVVARFVLSNFSPWSQIQRKRKSSCLKRIKRGIAVFLFPSLCISNRYSDYARWRTYFLQLHCTIAFRENFWWVNNTLEKKNVLRTSFLSLLLSSFVFYSLGGFYEEDNEQFKWKIEKYREIVSYSS